MGKKKDGQININVLKIRKRLDLTQEQTAEKMKCSRATYCNLEYGETSVFSKTALKFIKASGCSEVELVTGIAFPVNQDGTLMQEPDFEEQKRAIVRDYERRLEAERREKEKAQEMSLEKDKTIRAQDKTITSLEQAVKRLEKELERYSPD